MGRVLVTGLGIVSSIGVTGDTFWEALLSKRHNFMEFANQLPCVNEPCTGGFVAPEIFAELKSAIPGNILSNLEEDRTKILLVYSAIKAIADANLSPGSEPLRYAPIVLANLEPSRSATASHDPISVVRSFTSSHDIARAAAIASGSEGPVLAVHNTCASGNAALEFAVNMLRSGIADTVIVCGADAVSQRIFAGFHALGVVGMERCRPFSQKRKNITIAEGAAALVLQLEGVASTPSKAYAEIVAVESNNDAAHPTNPSLDGIMKCHLKILANPAVPRVPEVVFAHGTGSAANDAVEATVFQEHYPRAFVTAIKGIVGHTMGCAGLIGAVGSCLTVRHRIVPPNAIDREEIEYPLNLPTEPQVIAGNNPILVQSNSFGFGGSNAIAVFGTPPHA